MEFRKKIYIYGTGLTAKHVYELMSGEYEIVGFLNRSFDCVNYVSEYKKCQLYYDKEITTEMKQDSTVVVAIMNTQGNIRAVMKNLEKEGFDYVVPYAVLADCFPDKFQFLYLESSKQFEKRMPHIEEVRKILVNYGSDRRTMEVFDSMVEFRLTKNYDALPELDDKKKQYFPNDIDGYATDDISFVDCGAFQGDTFEGLLHWDRGRKNSKMPDFYYGFEPDIINYKILKKHIFQYENEHYFAYPYAVCEKEKELLFDTRGTTASRVLQEKKSETEYSIVKGISLDTFSFPVMPTHIKMDIEGEEYNALLGAKKMICSVKPKLAICIYHRPEDIYAIIKLLHDWDLGYRFEMRVYEDVGVDLVLYAL